MPRSWRIGSAFGIGLFVHWSFLLIPAFALLNGGVAGVGLVLALFGCVVLHELGHALAARHYGIGTRDITLYPIGGVARLEGMPERPFAEMVIAVAGPLVNVVIAGGLLLGVYLADLTVSIDSAFFGLDLLVQLFWLNVSLVVFNMIPAFPMDGGRVLRAVLAMRFGRLRATEIAVLVGRLAAGVFIAAPILSDWPVMLAVIGLFVLFAGAQELAMIRRQEAYRIAAGYVHFDRPFIQVSPTGPGNASGFTWDPRAGAWVQWRDGQPVGS